MKRLLALFTVLCGLAGCGPIQSTAFLLDADVALEAARTARAETYAPYEYTAAQLYLLKAREEVGYSDYEVAVDFAKKASKFANEAREKALSASANETTPPPPLPSAE
ncbi:MAG: DUF4398 domain-containing protein [Myxococcaceae bacterium]|nr:DUF4398 domain-containing protein [Myxococcaceae bacterium]